MTDAILLLLTIGLPLALAIRRACVGPPGLGRRLARAFTFFMLLTCGHSYYYVHLYTHPALAYYGSHPFPDDPQIPHAHYRA